ncbi:mechanosensitive ion channel family protein [Saprospiraceae bacterium]|nr:mechanosensitive ion channel family protein [Saprospiraceae bacterium]
MKVRLITLIEILLVFIFAFSKICKFDYMHYITMNNAASAVLGFLIFVIIIDLTRKALINAYGHKNNLKTNNKDNFQFGINNIAKFLIGFAIIVTLFAFFGIDFKSLITSISIVAAAVAIITKEYINDFIIGLYFSFSRVIEIDDYVKVAEVRGHILEISMLKIKLLNDDDVLVIIPNSKVYNSDIINYTKGDIRSLSIDFQIDINAIKNLELFEAELIASLDQFKEYLESNSFNLKIEDMKKDCIDIKFQYTLKALDQDVQKKIRRSTVRQVFNYISERRNLQNPISQKL